MFIRIATLSCVVAAVFVTGFAPTATTTTRPPASSTTTINGRSNDNFIRRVSFPLMSSSSSSTTTSLAAVMDNNSKTAGSVTKTSREKIYKSKETPKVLGGLNIGLRKLVVITGASSGLGLATAVSLAKTGKYFIVMACRDVEKGKKGTFGRETVVSMVVSI